MTADDLTLARLRDLLDDVDAQTRQPGEEPLWRAVVRQAREALAAMPPSQHTPTRDSCPVCGELIGGQHGTPAMAHDCEFPGCAFGPNHAVGYHLVDGRRVTEEPRA